MKSAFGVGLLEKSGGSGDGSGRFRELEIAFRPRLPTVPGRFRDGSVRFAQSLATSIKSRFSFRPGLPTVPARLRDGSVRFAQGLSTSMKSHIAFRPRLPTVPARFRDGSVLWPCQHGLNHASCSAHAF